MRNIFLCLITCFFLFGCTESELLNETGTLTLSNLSLPDLNDGETITYEYQAWLLLNRTFVSVGTFNFSDFSMDGNVNFSLIDMTDLADADAFAVTIEIANESNQPSNFVLMVGDFVGNTANLTSGNQTTAGVAAVGFGRSSAYTIQTPTTTAVNDDTNGIWFFEDTGTNVTTLNLNFGNERSDVSYQAWFGATLSDGNDYNLNIGVISGNAGADDSNLFITNTDMIPNFTGEDFVGDPTDITFPENTFPLDVQNGTVFITAIPTNYANNTIPFPITLFSAPTNGALTGASNSNPMTLNTSYVATAQR